MTDLRNRLQSSLGTAYTLERELGGGGMSRVFVATDSSLGRSVVVKVLPPEMAAGVSTERFKREISVAARLQHPHIVPLLSAGEMDGIPYFTMPLIDGESLRVRLARRGELPVNESVRVLREIASALAYAHAHGVVHRDIKPDNVLFSDDVAMVTDFGVAKALSMSSNGDHGGVTSLGVALGTPAYMAPEQATADPATDHRADVYAFGVLAYEMLTGQPPFVGRNPSQLLAAQVTEAPEPIGRRRPNLPPALAALVMRCLEKRPADRPQSASEVVHALDDITTPSGGMTPTMGMPATAPASLATPATSGAKAPIAGRRRVPLGAVVLGVVALAMAAAGVAVWKRGPEPVASSGPSRLAVLPFENLGDSADAYFADGVADAVRGKLTSLPSLEVIARASSVQYRHTDKTPQVIAQELGARYLLTGTVRWAKVAGGTSRVQVSPELVEVTSAGIPSSRWQQPFDAELADVFKVQGDIAGKVAEAMRVALGGGDQARLAAAPTTNPAAYDAYLRGEAAWNGGNNNDPASVRLAMRHFEEAVALDSTMTDAWVALAGATSNLYNNGVPTPALARAALRYAERARASDPSGMAGHRAFASYYRNVEVDMVRAAAELEAALRMAPKDARLLAGLAAAKQNLGRFDEAVRDLELSLTLDPRSPGRSSLLGSILIRLRRYPEARAALDRAMSLGLYDLATIEDRAFVEAGQGNLTAARKVISDALRKGPADELYPYVATYWDAGWLLDDAAQRLVLGLGMPSFDNDMASMAIVRAQLYMWRGDTTQARVWADSARVGFAAQLRELPGDSQRHALHGFMLAHLGRRSEAIAEGERAIAMRPTEADANGGPYLEHVLARIYLLSGEPEKAIDRLERLLKIPYLLSPGWLRIDPTWDSLRGNPRFQKLVAGA